MAKGTIDYGTPISSQQAAGAILRMIKTPIVGNVDLDHDPGVTLNRLYDEPLTHMLSGGEKRLRDIAKSVWNGAPGADIAELGGLDRDNRRRVCIVLWYYFLGRDLLPEEFSVEEWSQVFSPKKGRS